VRVLNIRIFDVESEGIPVLEQWRDFGTSKNKDGYFDAKYGGFGGCILNAVIAHYNATLTHYKEQNETQITEAETERPDASIS